MLEVNPYTYIIGWSQLDFWYYGVRYANKVPAADDLWKVYFTSSKAVAELRVQHGDPDVIIIDREFETAEEAISYEEQKLKDLNVLHESKWLNQNIAGAFGPDSPRGRMPGELNPFYNRTHSKSTRKRWSDMRKGTRTGEDNPFYGRQHTDETKKILSEKVRQWYEENDHPMKGKQLDDSFKRKISEAKKGVPNPKKRKRVEIDGIVYNSCTEAAQALGIGQGLVSYRIKTGKAKLL